MHYRNLVRFTLFLFLIFLLGLAVFFLSSNYFRKAKKITVPSTVALLVNGSPISREEYENALKYYRDIWLQDITSPEFVGRIKEELIERKLLEQWARETGVEVSEQEIIDKAREFYGEDPPLETYPELRSQAETAVLKNYFSQRSENWRDAQVFVIKFDSRGGEALKKEGKDPRKLSLEKIQPYYERAQKGENLQVLAEEAFTDTEIAKLNDETVGIINYDHYTKDLLHDEDPKLNEIIYSSNIGQLSDIFIIKYHRGVNDAKLIPWAYGFVRVIDGNKSEVTSLSTWLRNERSNAEIKDNVGL